MKNGLSAKDFAVKFLDPWNATTSKLCLQNLLTTSNGNSLPAPTRMGRSTAAKRRLEMRWTDCLMPCRIFTMKSSIFMRGQAI